MSPPPPQHGAVVIDKPLGITSFSVVAKLRKHFRMKKVGHAGTLDPMATGILVVLLGEATKLSNYMMDSKKRYEATLKLGEATDSLDKEGEITEKAPIPELTEAEVKAVLASFLGTHPQRPPRYSALKKDGQTYMDRARKGEVFEVPERPATCNDIQLLELQKGLIRFSCEVEKGFYVRSLGRDIAEKLGTVGHLVALRRTFGSGFPLESASPLDKLSEAMVHPLEHCLPQLQRLNASEETARDILHGKRPQLPLTTHKLEPGFAMALDPNGKALALVELHALPGNALEVQVKRGFHY